MSRSPLYRPLLALLLVALGAGPLLSQEVSYKKSWIRIVPLDLSRMVREGDSFDVKVDYDLDPSEARGAMRLIFHPLGPWVQNPSAAYGTVKGHVDYPWAPLQAAELVPGAGTRTFHFTVGKLFRYNQLTFMAGFESDGVAWPWHVRAQGPRLQYRSPFYDVTTDHPGGLFRYDEPVVLKVAFRDGAVKGEAKTLDYMVTDSSGNETPGKVAFVAGGPGEEIPLPLDVKARGTFLLQVQVPEWGKRELFFARIPDLAQATGGAPTPFGYSDNSHATPDVSNKVARLLGMTYCRYFFNWHRDSVQPERTQWHVETWDRVLASAQAEGIRPILCLYGPPPWIQAEKKASQFDYEPFPFDEAAWRESISFLALRWAGKVWGWEWLNEIVPPRNRAGSQPQTSDYLRFCQIGTEAVKKADPQARTLLAGGLWPRGFRTDLLKAGVGKAIDVLPVHYSDMAGVLDAQADLKAEGLGNVEVWDNESSLDVTTWGLPSREALRVSLAQSKWILDRWPDELVAGARGLVYFGGYTDAGGNWSYLLDEWTPRPVAATLAVLASKLALARPLGKFYAGDTESKGVFDLFEREGKPILVASSVADGAAVRVGINMGAGNVVVTDNQGNETPLEAPGGMASLPLSSMKVFVEGGNLDVLKSHLVLALGSGDALLPDPRLVVFRDAEGKGGFPVRVRNPYAAPLRGKLQVAVAAGGKPLGEISFVVEPGGSEPLQVPIAVPDGMAGQTLEVSVKAAFADGRLPASETRAWLTVADPAMLGNLLRNGGFENPAPAGAPDGAASWQMQPPLARRAPAEDALGLGKYVLRFENCPKYTAASQTLSLLPGQSYLYTAWVRNQDMVAGSNVTETLDDGSKVGLTINQVFNGGSESPFFRMLSARIDVPAACSEAEFSPIVKGAGNASFDNLRVTLYEGTPYAAEAHRAKGPVSLDGSLDGWDRSCPIPLFGSNALTVFRSDYAWTPQNLSGVAYLEWDEKALYFAMEVRDDHAVATTTGEETTEGDSVVLAIDPSRGTVDKAFAYYLSAADPGRGSGHFTLYRPPSRAGGLHAGQLAVDSSVYDMAVFRKGDLTTYELRIPWEELGGMAPEVGAKFGLALQLNDNDGQGRAAAMTWGGGLLPSWNPAGFGLCTLVP